MAPLVESWPAAELPVRAQIFQLAYRDKRRKGGRVDIFNCPLVEMAQYSCNPPNERPPEPGVVNCKTVTRLFRRCANGVTAETTALERSNNEDTPKDVNN